MSGPELRLVETVEVYRHDGGVLLAQGRKALRVNTRARWLPAALDRLRAGTTAEALAGELPAGPVRSLVDRLDRLGWLTREPRYLARGVPWDRQVGWLTSVTPDAQAAQRRLGASSVGVLGAGGIGCLVAQHLVAAGVPAVWLVDHDEVAAHNLNRQYLFRAADIGQPKVTAAARALREAAPGAAVHPVRRYVTRPSDLDVLPVDLDLLVVAADQPRTITDIAWTWSVGTNTPMTGGAVGLDTGYWGPLLEPAVNHCWQCFQRRRIATFGAADQMLEDGGEPTAYSFGPTNSLIAALVARDVILFLATGTCPSHGRRQVLAVTGTHEATGESVDALCEAGPTGHKEEVA